MPESNMTSLSEARNNLRQELNQIRSLSEKEVAAFDSALAPLIQPSVIYDSAATENARQAEEKMFCPLRFRSNADRRLSAKATRLRLPNSRRLRRFAVTAIRPEN